MIILDKRNTAPLPADGLEGTVSGATVSLSWTDQSTDETGFKVQRKTTVAGAWTTLDTVAANATSYSHSSGTGAFWYRVLATNDHGDSITSNEIEVVVP